jgi:glycosyltransferase involved in cell wall biosynthesis
MRIAQVSPLYESCPPRLYGGTERVVSILTEELVRQGHEVTLFASGDSTTSAELIASCPRALRLDAACRDPLFHHLVLVNRVAKAAERFDVVHFHADFLHFPVFANRKGVVLTTLHGRLDLPDLPAVLREFPQLPLVSISNAQRGPAPWASWCGTVYHGIPKELYGLGRGDGGYLGFIGRISPEKRPDLAIEIARRAGLPLTIAAKVDKVDRAYFRHRIKPLLKNPAVEYIGEIGDAEKKAFYGNALALLFPIDWPEPFGLVLIEAMANGTPVIAFRRGSVPEIVEHGVTGFIVDSLEEAAAAVPMARALDRKVIRARFEERFSAARMANDYVTLYRNLMLRGDVGFVGLTVAATVQAARDAA